MQTFTLRSGFLATSRVLYSITNGTKLLSQQVGKTRFNLYYGNVNGGSIKQFVLQSKFGDGSAASYTYTHFSYPSGISSKKYKLPNAWQRSVRRIVREFSGLTMASLNIGNQRARVYFNTSVSISSPTFNRLIIGVKTGDGRSAHYSYFDVSVVK